MLAHFLLCHFGKAHEHTALAFAVIAYELAAFDFRAAHNAAFVAAKRTRLFAKGFLKKIS